jgi:hypothetical protein
VRNGPLQEAPYQVLEMVQKLKDGIPYRRFKLRAVLKWFGAGSSD